MTPEAVMEAWRKYDIHLKAENILILYWSSNYFDINVLHDALEETTNQKGVIYCNALNL